MKTVDFLRGRRSAELDQAERAVLEDVLSAPKLLSPRSVVVRRGEIADSSTLLIEGLVGRYLEDSGGDRQLVALHVAGDFLDLHAFPLRHLDHDVVTLTSASVATVDHAALEQITERHPHLTRLLWYSTLLDAAIHREWIFRLGRLDGQGRVAHFIAEMAVRLGMVGRCDGRQFDLPITQSDIADACGLTNVHVSRVLRALRDAAVVEIAASAVTILDRPKLWRLAEFDPSYLYIDDNLRT